MAQATFRQLWGTMAISLEGATRLSVEMSRVMKLYGSACQHAPKVHPGVEPASYPILFTLSAGPQRLSLLAEYVCCDVSTVSRQVTTLVSIGLLDKVSDPRDGRACMVSLSQEGGTLVDHLKASRGQWFRQLLQDWEPADAQMFTDYLQRFAMSFQVPKITPFQTPRAMPSEPSKTNTSEVSR
jgi:DNA-binding MarR family transcriptional regulator